jgi:hypothetical protein
MRTLLLAVLFGSALFSQTRAATINERFENIDFAEGNLGALPSGWHLGQMPGSVYLAEIVASPCNSGGRCATLRTVNLGPNGFSFLYQNINATPHRGKRFTFRAAVRAEVSGSGNLARLLVRVHRENGQSSFFDNMSDHPITGATWNFYKIRGVVGPDARDIELGMQLFGIGVAWLDSISLNFSD